MSFAELTYHYHLKWFIQNPFEGDRINVWTWRNFLFCISIFFQLLFVLEIDQFAIIEKMLGFLNLLHGTMDLKHFYRCIQLSVDSLMRPAFQHNLAFTFIEEDSEQYRRHIVIVQSSIASQVAHAFSFLIQLNGYCVKVNINCR